MKPIVFVSMRTTGSTHAHDDLAEIGVARCEPFDAQPIDMFATTVRPSRGAHRAGTWLVDAMDRVRDLSRGAVLFAFDAPATRAFLDGVCERFELLPLEFEGAAVDVRSLVWPIAPACRSVEVLADAVGLDAAASVGCLGELRVLMAAHREIHRRARDVRAPDDLNADERAIVDTLTARIIEGRRVYGPWKVGDDRNYGGEALFEVVDALAYCGAKLVREAREKGPES